MKVECNRGIFDCQSSVELEAVLQRAGGEPLEEIWIYDQAPYPCLAILTNERQATLNYFVSEEEFYGSLGDLNRDGVVEFMVGSQATEVAASTVVSIDQAIACALQFFRAKAKPEQIEWAEL